MSEWETDPEAQNRTDGACFLRDLALTPPFLISPQKYLFSVVLHHCVAYRLTAGEELKESPINRSVHTGVHSGLFSPLDAARRTGQGCQLSPIWSAKTVIPQIRLLRAPSNLTLNVSRDGASTTSLGNLFQCLTTLIVKNFFLKSSLNLPSLSLKPLLLVLSQQALLKILEGCYKVSPEPSLLQAEQPQLSQPVFVGEVLQPSDHFCGPPLDPLQQLHVLVLRAPELDAVLQVRSHQSRAEWQNHLPRPAGHASFDAAQDTVGLLGCERTSLTHVQLFIHQYPQVLFRRAALNHIMPQPVLKPRIAPTQV
ncbi:hypothetical protein QYF61_007470 [Mycteria americana]|uniref:Uncharacterized protein n=1 Tax=Mycteria americana TaxID=33587 RepID=A0AAN7N8H0_MYCAM|nr:hypothetical protein QYF61_007470 [Mycteria americana]